MTAAALAALFAFIVAGRHAAQCIVFTSRQVTIPQMARAGIWLNLIGAVLITLFISLILPLVMELTLK